MEERETTSKENRHHERWGNAHPMKSMFSIYGFLEMESHILRTEKEIDETLKEVANRKLDTR